MAMPMAYCVPGAEVAKVAEPDHKQDCKKDPNGGSCSCGAVVIDSERGNSFKWRKITPQRGFIVKTKYPGDETYSSDAVLWVEVKFEKGKPAERCLPTQLNLVKVANEAALMALKNEVAIQRGNEALVQDLRSGPIDKTGVGRTKPGKGMSKFEAEDFDKE